MAIRWSYVRLLLEELGSIIFRVNNVTEKKKIRRFLKIIQISGQNCAVSDYNSTSVKSFAIINCSSMETKRLYVDNVKANDQCLPGTTERHPKSSNLRAM